MGRRLVIIGVPGKTGLGNTTAPTCVLTSAASDPVYTVFSVTATFSEVVIGFDAAADITVTNGTASDPVDSGDGMTYTFDVNPTLSGTVSVQVAAGVCADAAGNLNTASNTLSYMAVLWLLLDRFTTDRAAGAVDGTAAEPGPGTREANATPSIASGLLNVPSGGIAGLVDAITRAAGHITFYTKLDNNGTAIMGGFASNVSYGAGDGRLYIHGSAVKAMGSASAVILAPPASGARFVAVARPTGYFFLYSADGSTAWRLLWVNLTGSEATVYIGFQSFANTHNRDNLGLAKVLTTDPALYPIPVLSDSFNRADGALGSTDGAGHVEGQTTPQGNGVAYSNAATWTISSNMATNIPSGAADNLCYANGGRAEVFHTVKVTRSAGEAGIVLNAADTSNYLRVVHDGTNVITTEVIAGTPNVLSTVAGAYSAGARLSARRIVNTVRVFYNNVFIVEVTPNAALQNNTSHGLYSDSSGNTFDDLETWPTTDYDYGDFA